MQKAVVPNANLKVEGIPPIPAALAAKVAPYTEFRPTGLASWHPVRHELVVAKRARNTAQLFDVRAPLADPVQLTDFAEPVRNGGWWPAKPDVLVFGRDAGGNEQSQLYRLDLDSRQVTLLTAPGERHAIEGGGVDVFDAIDGGSAPTTDDSAQAAVAPADERSVHLVDPICGLLQRVSDDSAHLTGLVRLHYSRVT